MSSVVCRLGRCRSTEYKQTALIEFPLTRPDFSFFLSFFHHQCHGFVKLKTSLSGLFWFFFNRWLANLTWMSILYPSPSVFMPVGRGSTVAGAGALTHSLTQHEKEQRRTVKTSERTSMALNFFFLISFLVCKRTYARMRARFFFSWSLSMLVSQALGSGFGSSCSLRQEEE